MSASSTMRNVIDPSTAARLRSLASRYETAQFIDGDPSWFMHQVSGDANREAMAFLASCLSYGSRSQFLPKIEQLRQWSHGEVDMWLREGCYKEHFAADDSRCFYRLYSNGCMRSLLDAYALMLCEHGSMGGYLRGMACRGTGMAHVVDGLSAVEALCLYFAAHGADAVVPKNTQSACKRICMFLRWMVRDGSPVDLGLWSDFIDRRTLIMPLDTHVLTEAMRLGLMSARTASMSAARKLTDVMRQVFPDDPLRGDFALFGYGVDEAK